MKTASRTVWLIVGLALALRVIAAIAVDQHVRSAGRQFLIEGDANGYWELAVRLTEGRDYCIHQPPRYVLRTPGFPLLLAGMMLLTGPSVFLVSLLLAGVGTACVWFTWVLARRWLPPTPAAVAAAMMAVSPLQIGNSVLILSETWFAFWVLLNLLAISRLLPEPLTDAAVPGSDVGQSQDRTRSRRRLLIAWTAGLIAGLTVLVRPGWTLWPVTSGIIVMIFGASRPRDRVLQTLLIGVGCCVALLPWAWRNHEVTGHWIFTSLWSGPSLYDGLHPGATGASDMEFVDAEPIYATLSEYDANEHYKHRAWEFVVEHPARALELAFIKAGRYLSLTPNASGFRGGRLAWVCLAYYVPFFLLCLQGIWTSRQRVSAIALLVAPFLQFLLVHMVFVGSVRYRLPVEFPLSILAANGWAAVSTMFSPLWRSSWCRRLRNAG